MQRAFLSLRLFDAILVNSDSIRESDNLQKVRTAEYKSSTFEGKSLVSPEERLLRMSFEAEDIVPLY